MPQLLRTARARAVFEALDDELEELEIEGRTAWVLAGDTSFPSAPAAGVRLLPEYDAYVLGFRERDELVPDRAKEVIARGRGRYEGVTGSQVLLVDGRVAGTWSRRKHGRKLELGVTPVQRLTRAQRAELAGEAERIGLFLGLEPVLTVA
jgi:winged helix DNA-binding protein